MDTEFIISEQEMESNKQKILDLLMSTNRPGMDKLIGWINSTDFFVAPASTKYHLHCKGGLALHSLNVYERLKAKRDAGLITIKDDSLIITSILHDICKANFYEMQPRNRKIDGVWKEVFEWGVNDQMPIGHGEKSCFIIQSYMRLRPEEFAMIRYHMGRESLQYGDNFSTAAAQYPNVVALHTADMESAYIVEARM